MWHDLRNGIIILAEWHNYAECNFLKINYTKKARQFFKRSRIVKYRGLKHDKKITHRSRLDLIFTYAVLIHGFDEKSLAANAKAFRFCGRFSLLVRAIQCLGYNLVHFVLLHV